MTLFAALAGWITAFGMLFKQCSMASELGQLRRYRNAAEGRGYYTRAEVDDAFEQLRNVVFASADTRPKGGDGTKIAAPSVTSGAVPEGQTPSPSPSPAAGR